MYLVKIVNVLDTAQPLRFAKVLSERTQLSTYQCMAANLKIATFDSSGESKASYMTIPVEQHGTAMEIATHAASLGIEVEVILATVTQYYECVLSWSTIRNTAKDKHRLFWAQTGIELPPIRPSDWLQHDDVRILDDLTRGSYYQLRAHIALCGRQLVSAQYHGALTECEKALDLLTAEQTLDNATLSLCFCRYLAGCIMDLLGRKEDALVELHRASDIAVSGTQPDRPERALYLESVQSILRLVELRAQGIE